MLTVVDMTFLMGLVMWGVGMNHTLRNNITSIIDMSVLMCMVGAVIMAFGVANAA